jgi:hypothetical protein
VLAIVQDALFPNGDEGESTQPELNCRETNHAADLDII